jgi:hypothetical protein
MALLPTVQNVLMMVKVGASGVTIGLTSLFLYFIPGYKKTLTYEKDEWWLRGEKKTAGKFLLHLLLKLPSYQPKLHDKMMKVEANNKAQLLLQSGVRPGGVCFLGSSTFTYWTQLEQNMKAVGIDVPCYNAAFGGSCTRNVLEHVDELCISLKPCVIVMFCGTNDINMECSLNSATDNIASLFNHIHKSLPGSRIVYLTSSITPFVEWRGDSYVDKMKYFNNEVRELVTALDFVEYVDSGEFQREADFYLGDAHHLNLQGHMKLARLLEPAVRRAIKATSTASAK